MSAKGLRKQIRETAIKTGVWGKCPTCNRTLSKKSNIVGSRVWNNQVLKKKAYITDSGVCTDCIKFKMKEKI
jgi:hypothetical protein